MLAYMEREFIGQGAQHKVYSSKHTGRVLKVPYGMMNLLAFMRIVDASDLREDFKRAEKMVEGTEIVVPKTRVFRYKRGYVIEQPYIKMDGSIPNPKQLLAENNLDILALLYEVKPDNFAISCDKLYWIDPTRGLSQNLLVRTNILTLRQYIQSKRLIKLGWRKLKARFF